VLAEGSGGGYDGERECQRANQESNVQRDLEADDPEQGIEQSKRCEGGSPQPASPR